MGEALGQGWLVALVVAFPTFVAVVFVPLGRWVAKRWRRPVEKLEEALKEKTTELIEEQKLRMYYEIKYDYCQSELRHWRSRGDAEGGP